uniref:Menorin-like domain-containing protein n=1 Tax=Macrostomum lignano TaxID=282301 RepID=A0A1I8JNP9_9PLAT
MVGEQTAVRTCEFGTGNLAIMADITSEAELDQLDFTYEKCKIRSTSSWGGSRTGKRSSGWNWVGLAEASNSDLTFDEYLATVAASNSTVGIKLDFKAIEVVELCLQRVARVADRLPGPVSLSMLTSCAGLALRLIKMLTTMKHFFFRSRSTIGGFLRFHSELTRVPSCLSVGQRLLSQGHRQPPLRLEHVGPHVGARDFYEREIFFRIGPSAVTFPVRASLLSDSLAQLCWLVESLRRWWWRHRLVDCLDGQGRQVSRSLKLLCCGATELNWAAGGCFVDLPGLDVSSIAARNASLIPGHSSKSQQPLIPNQPRRRRRLRQRPQPPSDCRTPLWCRCSRPIGPSSPSLARRRRSRPRLCRHSRQPPVAAVSRHSVGAKPPLASASPRRRRPVWRGGDGASRGVAIGLMDGGIRVHIDVTVGSRQHCQFDIVDGSTERQRRRAELSTRRTRSGGEVWYSLEHRP